MDPADHRGTDPAPTASTRPSRAPRRTDPGRRDRIIDACLDVIAAGGVNGTSHRKVAAAADVPLGSMTYHFAGIDDLLHAAFTRFADGVAAQFETRMAQAGNPEQALAAVTALVAKDVFAEPRDLAITLELYTLAAREPAYRTITQHWMERSRAALERHFDPPTARQLDALIEGLTIHRALATTPDEPAPAAEAIRRIARAD